MSTIVTLINAVLSVGTILFCISVNNEIHKKIETLENRIEYLQQEQLFSEAIDLGMRCVNEEPKIIVALASDIKKLSESLKDHTQTVDHMIQYLKESSYIVKLQ